MIDVRLQLSVSDARRRFDLDIAFATDAPFVALYGPSGAGKSLTLQAMLIFSFVLLLIINLLQGWSSRRGTRK